MNNKVVQMVADKVLAEMEKGVIPWHKPWSDGFSCAVSYNTGKPYSLLNQFLLGQPGEYITFKQCVAAGGTVKKGEKSSFVVYWNIVKKEEADEKTGGKKLKSFPVLRYYNVFRIDQCEGIEGKRKIERFEHKPVSEMQGVIDAYTNANPELKLVLSENGDSSYYNSLADEIVVPGIDRFEDINQFYSTVFHEIIHSTGAKHRLNRLTKTSFGSEEYGREELVAEIGAASLLSSCGVDTTIEESASYIDNWMRAIRENPDIIVVAAGKAEKAVDFVLNGVPAEAAA